MLMVLEPRRVNLAVRDGLWLRVIDVVEALQRRSYSADGSIVFDITDEYLPAAGGRFLLSTTDGRGTVERTDAAADISMTAADLGSLYLGDQTFVTLASAGRTTELTPGAYARADAMLRTNVRPWCPQVF
jgi:predicted acetyltransferase